MQSQPIGTKPIPEWFDQLEVESALNIRGKKGVEEGRSGCFLHPS